LAGDWLYDGESALRWEVEVEPEGDGLIVRRAGLEPFAVPSASLCHVERRRDFEVYGRRDVPGWRLGLSEESRERLSARLPAEERYGRLIDRVGLLPAVAVGLALSALVVFLGLSFPSWVAPHVPRSWEKRMGDSLVGDFGGRFCAGPGGQKALDKLAARLSPGASSLNIRVVQVPVVNAAALPGGNIVVFDELLKESDGPDEFAGVLAHEIAHVEERHTTEAMIRQLGVGALISALGGSTGANVETLLSARYSRSAETEADDDAIRTLARADISPLGTAKFFERLGKQEGKLGRAADPLSYLSTHPVTAERERKFRGSAVKGRAYRPALTRDEWDAIFNICFNDPDKDRKRISLF
jgi:Zn-dependent protease with chaperone function